MSDAPSDESLVEVLAEEFLERRRRGERPTMAEYLDRYPHAAAGIREVFPVLGLVEDFKPAPGDVTGTFAGASVPGLGRALERVGDYRVLREVGRGGMGVVYEAEQESLGRRVALKVLTGTRLSDAKLVTRFHREARAAARLHHTNIVPVFGVGEAEGVHYYVMQFIQGLGLDEVLEELRRLGVATGANGALPPTSAPADAAATPPDRPGGRDAAAASIAHSLAAGRFEPPPTLRDPAGSDPAVSARTGAASSSVSLPGQADLSRIHDPVTRYAHSVARVGHQVAEALEHAHEQGILHRDIKPSNLLLDAHGNVWVADFGLAKVSTDDDLTHTGDIVGTLRYMAPERFNGKCDRRSDVYALGLTLYELLARRPAFAADDRNTLIREVTQTEPPRLRRLDPRIPRDLETIVHKAIDRDPGHRYNKAAELSEDLRRFLEDRPITARRAGPIERLNRWRRRNPAQAALTAAVFGLILLLNVAATLGEVRMRRERDRANFLARQAQESAKLERRSMLQATAEKQNAMTANQALLATQETLRRTLYAAQLNLAQNAGDAGKPGRMLALLETTRPKPGETDLRGFEWHYLRRLAHGERAVRKLPGVDQLNSFHSSPLSPDGTLVGSVRPPYGRTEPAVLLIHETATGRIRHRIPVPVPYRQESYQTAVAFSGDATRVAVVVTRRVASATSPTAGSPPSIETDVLAWNLEDDRLLVHEAGVERGIVALPALALDRGGHRLAVSFNLIESVARPYADDPLRERVISYGWLKVLDLDAGRELLHLVSDRDSYAFPSLSPDGRLVAANTVSTVGGRSASLILAEVDGGRLRLDLPYPGATQERPLRSGFSPDGKVLAVQEGDVRDNYNFRLVDTATGETLVREALPVQVGGTASIAFSPDSRSLVIGSNAGPGCEVREVPSGRLLRRLSLAGSGVYGLGLRPEGDRMVTIDAPDNVREWDWPFDATASLDAGRVLPRVMTAGLSDDGHTLVSIQSADESSRPYELTTTDVATGAAGRTIALAELGELGLRADERLTLSRHGSWIVFPTIRRSGNSSQIEEVEVWDAAAARRVLRLDRQALGGGMMIQTLGTTGMFDAAGTRLAIPIRPDATATATAFAIVELPSGRLLRTIACPSRPEAALIPRLPAALRPDGRQFALGVTAVSGGRKEGRIQIHDVDTGEIVRVLESRLGAFHLLVYSDDGRRLAAASNRGVDTVVQVWDLSGDSKASGPWTLSGHDDNLFGLLFSPDGSRLATFTGSPFSLGSNTFKLWNIEGERDVLSRVLEGGSPADFAFEPDGRRLRILLSQSLADDVRVLLLDATPLAPEVEASDLVDRLGSDVPLNADLAGLIRAQPGLDPAIRDAALALAADRHEPWATLLRQARFWLDLDAGNRTPELMKSALEHAERAVAIVPEMWPWGLSILGEARYRNGLHAECLDPLRRALELDAAETVPRLRAGPRPLAFLALAEARLGHRDAARAALERLRSAPASGPAALQGIIPPALRAEVEALVAEPSPSPHPAGGP